MAYYNGRKIPIHVHSNAGIELQQKSVTITENGQQTVMPDAGKALSKVTVIVSIPSYDGSSEVIE